MTRKRNSTLQNRNVFATNGRTSLRLETELWSALEFMLARQGVTFAQFVRDLEKRGLTVAGGRTSAVRVAIVNYYRSAAQLLQHPVPAPLSAAAKLETTQRV